MINQLIQLNENENNTSEKCIFNIMNINNNNSNNNNNEWKIDKIKKKRNKNNVDYLKNVKTQIVKSCLLYTFSQQK